eukprot:755712-Rhodomonas_salina.1
MEKKKLEEKLEGELKQWVKETDQPKGSDSYLFLRPLRHERYAMSGADKTLQGKTMSQIQEYHDRVRFLQGKLYAGVICLPACSAIRISEAVCGLRAEVGGAPCVVNDNPRHY